MSNQTAQLSSLEMGVPMPRRLWAIVAVSFGVVMAVMDGTIANVALPTICKDLGIASADSIWIINAYQLTIMVLLLSLSALGDIIGHRRVYIVGLVIFTLASALCAMASSLEALVAARIVQGMGAAAITSVNTTLVRFIYPKSKLGRGMGINATVVAVSAVAGPTIAAVILSVGEWSWLFLVNIPIGILTLVLSLRYLPMTKIATKVKSLRWADVAMNALTFGLLIGAIEGYAHGVNSTIIAIGFAAVLTVGAIFVRQQSRRENPILPLDLLRKPIFSLSIATSIFSFMGQMLTLVALPFILQHKYGFSDVDTGLMMTVWPAAIMVVAPLAGIAMERLHAGLLGGVGLALMSVMLLLMFSLRGEVGVVDILWRLLLCGVGFGMFQSPNSSTIIASAPAARSGSASGMLATARLTGQSIGAAMMAFLFHRLPDESTHYAFLVSAVLVAVAALISLSRVAFPLPEAIARGRK